MAVRTQRLHTPFEDIAQAIPFSSYPRPQLVRDSYYCLNGEWSLSLQTTTGVEALGKIRVPFPPESAASGIGRTLAKNEHWIYERHFMLPDGFKKDRVRLHVGAADTHAAVFVNDREIISHSGGYLPFFCDITEALCDGDNTLRIVVSDNLDTDYPYGKQRKKRGGMWYTPISGIWQTVWLESVPASPVESLKITPALDSVTIETVGGIPQKRLTLHMESSDIVTVYSGDRVTLTIDDPKLWTPETPYLYRFTLQTGEDIVQSYFALRTVSIGKVGKFNRLLLNGKPYFFHGLLDQGYFADGIYLPSSEEGYRFDIRQMKALGFNTLRKHIKIEPEVFYYECDRLGMIVFQDLVNNGKYRFVTDTALPTLGLKRGILHRASARRRAIFETHSRDTVMHLYNHPCICYYTLFNEGWGQYDADRLYRDMKALDGTRIWDATSGWFAERDSDVQSEHIYFKPVTLTADERPLVLSEFGGYSCKVAGHVFNLDKTYGYRLFETVDELETALVTLYRGEIIPSIRNGLCAAILTQVSDVEDEVNGLVTYDRQVCKVDESAMHAVADELQAAFEDSFVE